jgi:hypothetical protein
LKFFFNALSDSSSEDESDVNTTVDEDTGTELDRTISLKRGLSTPARWSPIVTATVPQGANIS